MDTCHKFVHVASPPERPVMTTVWTHDKSLTSDLWAVSRDRPAPGRGRSRAREDRLNLWPPRSVWSGVSRWPPGPTERSRGRIVHTDLSRCYKTFTEAREHLSGIKDFLTLLFTLNILRGEKILFREFTQTENSGHLKDWTFLLGIRSDWFVLLGSREGWGTEVTHLNV